MMCNVEIPGQLDAVFEKVITHYSITGPVKAALESCVRYMAAELGPKMIRVNCLSPGTIATGAASGIDHFDAMLERAPEITPPSIGSYPSKMWLPSQLFS